MTRGLYRRKKRGKNGKWRDTGAYVLDMRIKKVSEFVGIPVRLFKTTGVFPTQRNAVTIVAEMKLMIKELINQRDAVTLRKIQSNKLSLASAFKKWKTGRMHLAEGYEDHRVLKLWREYYEQGSHAKSTIANRLGVISSLVKKQLLTENTVVNELPECLLRIRGHYETTRQAATFNTIRIEVCAFLTKKLRMERDSVFVRDVMRVEPMKMGKQREHQPFFVPSECEEFISELSKMATSHMTLYASSVLFMCLHGLRPDEFASRRFAIDSKTNHLRVLGTKNPNATRVVPLMSDFRSAQIPKVGTLNSIFKRMGSDVRCRDFRRTYSIWCEQAGIPASRVRSYMGHGDQSVTHLYQRNVPKRETLSEDHERLLNWFKAELAKPAKRRQRDAVLSERSMLSAVMNKKLGTLLFAVAEQEAKDQSFNVGDE